MAFCFPVGEEKSVDTFPPVTGTSGQMGEPHYEMVQGGEATFLRFDREEAYLDAEFQGSAANSVGLMTCAQSFTAKAYRFHSLVSCRICSSNSPVFLGSSWQ